MLDLPSLTSFQKSKLSRDNLFGMPSSRKYCLRAAAHPDTQECHRGRGLSVHARQIECSKVLRITNAERVIESARPNDDEIPSYLH